MLQNAAKSANVAESVDFDHTATGASGPASGSVSSGSAVIRSSVHAPARARVLLTLAAWAAAVVLCALAGCAAPPVPQVGCRLDTECASGRCLAGLCVPVDLDATDASGTSDAHDATNTDVADGHADASDVPVDTGWADAGDAVTVDVPTACTQDAECVATDAPACAQAACHTGKCVLVAAADGTSCATADLCPAAGVCAAGVCKATAKACDDGNPCTVDTCVLSDGCTHVNKADGPGGCAGDSPCTVGVCTAGVCFPGQVAAGVCRIDGACFDAGDAAPGNACAHCVPDVANTTWTLTTSGPCDDGSACTTDDSCSEAGACTGTGVNCDDANPCTTDACVAASGCAFTPTSAACDDGNPCSIVEACQGGACVVHKWNTCDDGNVCTTDLCTPSAGCTHTGNDGPCIADNDACTVDKCMGGACAAVPMTSVCVIDGLCHPAGANADGEPCLVCVPDNDTTKWTALNATPCDDDNACTAGDACYSGACLGAVAGCDDKNPCTVDNCGPQTGCVFLPTQTACNDGDACTAGDDCTTGKCAGLPLGPTACDDDNVCTDDACNPLSGCTHAPNLVPCDDGDTCSQKDFCTAGLCHAGKFVCNCFTNADCDDQNACTVDGCDPLSMCVNQPIANAACEDGNACTTLDHCASGYCVGALGTCDDANPCTLDGCAPDVGCIHKAREAIVCDDGNPCTTADLCVIGVCQGVAKNCDDGKVCTTDTCSAVTGKCDHVTLPDGSTCTSDGSACTIDACVSAVCSHAAIVPGLCQIDGVCMLSGTTMPGEPCLGCVASVSQVAWSVRLGLACSDGNACTAGDACTSAKTCVGSPVACEDSNPCTVDVCNPLADTAGGTVSPCLHAPVAATCTDADPCTQNDACVLGVCKGEPTVCDDKNICTLDACVPGQGCASSPASSGSPCAGDGFPCTIDACAGGVCVHTVATDSCLTGGQCWSAGQASPTDPCWNCQPLVLPSGWSPANGGTCDDGNPCTLTATCENGTCVGSSPAPCDDSDPCTTDACAPKSGCVHAATTGGSCEDGDLCTTGDTCVSGVCAPGPAVSCPAPASGTCLVSTCSPTLGCGFASRCNALESCTGGLCATVDADGTPMGVTVPLDPGLSPQPLAPTLRWQAADPEHGAPLAHLRLAVQTRGCSPALGLYSTVAEVALLPRGATPTVHYLPATSPTGSAAWCAVAPQFSPPVDGISGAVLSWLEGGNALSGCDIASKGGAFRLGVFAPGAATAELGPLAECPVAGVTSARPAVWLQAQAGAGVADIAGAIARPTKNGTQLWLGQATSGWGQSGLPLQPATWLGMTDAPTMVRPLFTHLPGGLALTTVSQHQPASGDTLFSLDLAQVPADFSQLPSALPVLAGVDNTATKVVYRGADVVADPDSQKVVVLLSGTLSAQDNAVGFLSLARVHPGDPAVVPTVLRFFPQPAGSSAPPVLHAFRLAEIPGSQDVLIAFGGTDDNTLQLLRVQPVSDLYWTVVSAKVLATDFVSHETGDLIVNSGGLSELAISPDGQTVSLVYETVGAVRLFSLPVP